MIGRDIDLTDRDVVEWTAKWAGNFTVQISNYGRVYTDYLLLGN